MCKNAIFAILKTEVKFIQSSLENSIVVIGMRKKCSCEDDKLQVAFNAQVKKK